MSDSPELEQARAAVNVAAAGAGPTPAEAIAEIPGATSTLEAPYAAPPGTPGALAEVQAARAAAEASRRDLQREVDQLKATGRRTFDLRAQVESIPDRIRRDPRRAAVIGGATVAAVVGIRTIRRVRRAKPPTFLPPEVEAALGSLGPDADAVREALDRSFTKFLEEHGARGPLGRLPRGTVFVILPVVSTLVREAVRQYARRMERERER